MAGLGHCRPLHHRRKMTLEMSLRDEAWIRDIPVALTVPIILQYLDARHHIDPVQLLTNEPDRFFWRWMEFG
jgi:hypothetical protein